MPAPRPDASSETRLRGPSWRSRLTHLPQGILLSLLRGYRLLLSPWLGSACRFEPTCSRYAMQAIERHGAASGSYLAAARLLRCHPWCAGGHDPIPARRTGWLTFETLATAADQPVAAVPPPSSASS